MPAERDKPEAGRARLTRLTIDASCVIERGRPAEMETIERWAREGKVLLLAAERLAHEARDPVAGARAFAMQAIGEPSCLE
jgi:hypothetical protein